MSDKQFLYQEYDILSKRINKDIPSFVKENLNKSFELRSYQIEAFSRFFDYYTNYDEKEMPIHLLFNMATGSGKTLIMAWLILYLYVQWYRNFLFFVNTNNIIEKTKDNFLKKMSSKYLFNQKISIDGKIVNINQVDNFEGVNENEVNICFTTIQKLHSDLYNIKEDSVTISDFKKTKIVLLSDEAHHIQAKTKAKKWQTELIEKPSFENTVENTLRQNMDNILLEFTATMDYKDKAINEKYINKILYRYDLKEFRNAWYSKDIHLLQSNFDEKYRIIQAIILNQYKQEVAGKYWINLKPVIMFKAQRTIEESKRNQHMFNELIEELCDAQMEHVCNASEIWIIKRAFKFFHENNVSNTILVQKLKNSFAPNKCLNVNEINLDNKQIKKEEVKEFIEQASLLNSLEDKHNQIRAIFAVNKLNEWWDVLNLFDIVRLYETRSNVEDKWWKIVPWPQTIAEAQLIWRGARYRPFALQDHESRDKRKFDSDIENDLRVIEELHYHSYYNSSYISELRTALIEKWFMDENTVEKELTLKDKFKWTDFFQNGIIYLNRPVKNTYEGVRSISDLWVKNKNIEYLISSGAGTDTEAFNQETQKTKEKTISQDLSLKEVEKHIIQNALSKYNFYTFESLKHYFKTLDSMSEFITGDDYLGWLSLTLTWPENEVKNLTNENKFRAIKKLLETIEKEMKGNMFEYKGTDNFNAQAIKEVFFDKILKINKDDERVNWQEDFVQGKDWYVFNANYGTSEEKQFVKMIDRQIQKLQEKYDEIFVIRNELHFKIFNFKDGQAFSPDFVVFMRNKSWEKFTYQIFIEPKGKHLIAGEKWKKDFLEEIMTRKETIIFNETKKYRIVWVPFYNTEDENEFKKELEGCLD